MGWCFTSLSTLLSHIKTMEGWWWKALFSEAPYIHELNSASSGWTAKISSFTSPVWLEFSYWNLGPDCLDAYTFLHFSRLFQSPVCVTGILTQRIPLFSVAYRDCLCIWNCSWTFNIRCATHEKGRYTICGHHRPWSAYAFAQADQGLRYPLTESRWTGELTDWRNDTLCIPLRRHAYSNTLKILLPKKWKFSDKIFWYF